MRCRRWFSGKMSSSLKESKSRFRMALTAVRLPLASPSQATSLQHGNDPHVFEGVLQDMLPAMLRGACVQVAPRPAPGKSNSIARRSRF